ncbi:histidine--tRNA ligase, cytoplasmic-like isoform X2 [Rutidosis leptorrhynchoides]|uniref:histidine--tRNA ligase, cytoplasmic-like isoform X2 n=1 Tax=Rutidosis leptorrhynchoides TaxID=125765 RepID=UPI003A995A9D
MEFATSNRKQVKVASLDDYKKATYAIIDVFRRHVDTGMTFETPVIELKETFKKIYGEDYSKFIQDSDDLVNEDGKELCVQQYDLVVPFARYVGRNCLKSFKAYQLGIVYRDNEKYYQCSVDFAGDEAISAEVHVVYILKKVLDGLDMGDYKIKLNHKKLLDGMLVISGVPRHKFRTVCSCIDKLQDNHSLDQIKKELMEDEGLDVETVKKIGWFLSLRGPPSVVFSRIRKRYGRFKSAASLMQVLKLLEKTFRVLDLFRLTNKVFLDLSLSLSRRPDYYTGGGCFDCFWRTLR